MGRKFLADAMLGRLAKWLRVMGYDTHYQPSYGPGQITSLVKGGRLLLTRNSQWLRRSTDTVFVRPDHIKEQLRQLHREGWIEADRKSWFTLCLLCNEPLLDAPLESVRENVPEHLFFNSPSAIRFCPSCNRFFWPGSHRQNMLAQLEAWGF